MRDFKNLEIWRSSHKLGLEIFKITKKFPPIEDYCLTNQIRRSVLSVTNNIAEGCGRNSQKEFYHFLNIAMGSSAEVENLLMLANDRDYREDDFHKLQGKIIDIRKVLNV